MFEVTLTVNTGKVSKTFALEVGESKKGTYKTVSAPAGNKVIPFGKLYIDDNQLNERPAKKANDHPATSSDIRIIKPANKAK